MLILNYTYELYIETTLLIYNKHKIDAIFYYESGVCYFSSQ